MKIVESLAAKAKSRVKDDDQKSFNTDANSNLNTNAVTAAAVSSNLRKPSNTTFSSVSSPLAQTCTFNLITSTVKPSDLRFSTVVFGLPLNIIMQRTGQPLPQKMQEEYKNTYLDHKAREFKEANS